MAGGIKKEKAYCPGRRVWSSRSVWDRAEELQRLPSFCLSTSPQGLSAMVSLGWWMGLLSICRVPGYYLVEFILSLPWRSAAAVLLTGQAPLAQPDTAGWLSSRSCTHWCPMSGPSLHPVCPMWSTPFSVSQNIWILGFRNYGHTAIPQSL